MPESKQLFALSFLDREIGANLSRDQVSEVLREERALIARFISKVKDLDPYNQPSGGVPPRELVHQREQAIDSCLDVLAKFHLPGQPERLQRNLKKFEALPSIGHSDAGSAMMELLEENTYAGLVRFLRLHNKGPSGNTKDQEMPLYAKGIVIEEIDWAKQQGKLPLGFAEETAQNIVNSVMSEVSPKFEEARTSISELQESLDNHRSLQAEASTKLGEIETGFDDVRRQFLGKLATDTSHTLWSSRSTLFNRYTVAWLAAVVVAFIGCASVGAWTLPKILGLTASAAPDAPSVGSPPAIALNYAALIVVSLVILGLLRFVTSEYKRNAALAADAAERVAMIRTFVALQGELEISKQERAFVIQRLFQPHAIERDDGEAQSLMEMVTRSINNSGK